MEVIRANAHIFSLFEYGQQFGIPTKLVIIDYQNNSMVYNDPLNVIYSLSDQNFSLEEIYEYLHGKNINVSRNILIYYYIQYLYNGNYNPKEFINIDPTKFNIIKDFLSAKNTAIINSNNDLDEFIKNLYKITKDALEEDIARYYEMKDIYDHVVENTRELPEYSDFEETGYRYEIKPTLIDSVYVTEHFESKIPNPDMGLDIFNTMKATIYIPFIQINTNNNNYYKIYNSDFNIDQFPANEREEDNSIYMIIYVGSVNLTNQKSIKNIPYKSFSLVRYDLNSNSISIEISTDYGLSYLDIVEYLNEAGPLLNFDISNETQTYYKGYFDIYDQDIELFSWLDYVMLDYRALPFLWVDETSKVSAFKKRLDINFNQMYHWIGTKIKVKIGNENEMDFVEPSMGLIMRKFSLNTAASRNIVTDQGVTFKTFEAGTNIIRIFVKKQGVTRGFKDFLVLMMRRILCDYNQPNPDISEREYLLEEYHELVPLIDLKKLGAKVLGETKRMEQEENERTATMKKLNILKRKSPDIFMTNYSTRCSADKQPILVPPDKIGEWTSQTFVSGGVVRNRQILLFPNNNPKLYIGCDNPEYPFPGVFSNNLDNKEEYPYLPCCYKEDQMISANAKYMAFLGLEERVYESKPISNIKSNRVLHPNNTAVVSKNISKFLEIYRPNNNLPGDAKDWHISRYGVPHNTNSLLHCICISVLDQKYLELNREGRERYLELLRIDISNSVNPSIAKQELYDRNDEQIRSEIANNAIFLDPDLYFRALEVYFNINIYVFGISRDTVDRSYIRVPRHLAYHSRPPRNELPSVLILRHWGIAVDNLKFPHCELIVDVNFKSLDIILLFGVDITSLCHDALVSVSSTLTWMKNEVPTSKSLPDVNQEITFLQPHLNIYSITDYPGMLGVDIHNNNLVSQYIDNKGKARAFTLKFEKNNNEVHWDGLITFIVYPVRSENVPNSSMISEAPITSVLSRLDDAVVTSRSIDKFNRTTGIWLQLFDISEGVYIPINPDSPISSEMEQNIDQLPRGSPNPLDRLRDNNRLNRIIKLSKDLNFIDNIVIWLFEIKRTYHPEMSIEQFINKILKYQREDIEDSTNYYDFSRLPRYLPHFNNLDVAIQHINNYTNQSFDDGIKTFSQNLYNKLGKRITTDLDKISKGNIDIPKFINDYYILGSDFYPFENNLTIIGNGDFGAFLEQKKLNSQKIYNINLDLTGLSERRNHPYLFAQILNNDYSLDQVINVEIMIISSSKDESLNAALKIALFWHLYQINISNQEIEDDWSHVGYILYGISPNQDLEILQDNRKAEEEIYVKILYHPETYYAILPLI